MLDIIVGLLFIISFAKGWSDGLIKSLFNLVGWIAGIAIALKFTAFITWYIHNNHDIKSKLLPFIVFIGIFILIYVIIFNIGKLLEHFMEKINIDKFNKLAGGLVSAGLMTILMSTFLFFLNNMGFITEARKRNSWSYSILEPIAPVVIGLVTDHIGDTKSLFKQMKEKYDAIDPMKNVPAKTN